MGRLIKRSLTLDGHRTSVALEEEFWDVLDALADEQGKSIAALVRELDQARGDIGASPGNLASMLRVHALRRVRSGALAGREGG